MKSSFKTKEDEIWEELFPRIVFLIKKNKWAWQSVGAVLGLCGGILSIVLTIVLPFVIFWLTPGDLVSILEKISFIFLALSLPLLAVGSHCLDLLEKKSHDFPAAEMRLYLKNVKNAEFDF
jgi:hypothetical protein